MKRAECLVGREFLWLLANRGVGVWKESSKHCSDLAESCKDSTGRSAMKVPLKASFIHSSPFTVALRQCQHFTIYSDLCRISVSDNTHLLAFLKQEL